MGWAKDFYHEEICAMAESEEASWAAHAEAEAFDRFIDEETRVADSYPHDLRWAQAVAHLAMYGRGIMTKNGAATA